MGEKILLRKEGYKMEAPYKGPYEIITVYDNGTVRIRKGIQTETVNIRRIQPYKE